MIRVPILVDFCGDPDKRQVVREIIIWNDGTGDEFIGNYNAVIAPQVGVDWRDKEIKGPFARIENWNRERDITELVAKAMDVLLNPPLPVPAMMREE